MSLLPFIMLPLNYARFQHINSIHKTPLRTKIELAVQQKYLNLNNLWYLTNTTTPFPPNNANWMMCRDAAIPPSAYIANKGFLNEAKVSLQQQQWFGLVSAFFLLLWRRRYPVIAGMHYVLTQATRHISSIVTVRFGTKRDDWLKLPDRYIPCEKYACSQTVCGILHPARNPKGTQDTDPPSEYLNPPLLVIFLRQPQFLLSSQRVVWPRPESEPKVTCLLNSGSTISSPAKRR